jgi:hypothetical protein
MKALFGARDCASFKQEKLGAESGMAGEMFG